MFIRRPRLHLFSCLGFLSLWRFLLCILLDAPPFHRQRSKNRETGQDESKTEDNTQRLIVANQNVLLDRSWQICQGRGTAALNQSRIEARDRRQTLKKLVVEDVLANGDEDGTPKKLREEHEGGTDRDILLRKYRLSGDVGDLRGTTGAEAVQNLISDPLGTGSIQLQGVQESSADAHEADSDDKERCVVAGSANESSRHQRRNDHGEHQWEQANA